MDTILNVYKRAGETPLERINRLRLEKPELAKLPMSYAGRLDPMAEGVLLILIGPTANKNREAYLLHNKQYSFEILFGLKTDTYDILGLPHLCEPVDLSKIKPENIRREIELLKGKIMQSYPPYSSRTVKGKPLFQWAREGRLDEIEIPKNEIELYNAELISERTEKGEDLEKHILQRIDLVKGDFRQNEIREQWKTCLADKKQQNFPVYTVRISCSSGTYVRAVVHSLGERVGTGAVALRIVRERVGDHDIADSEGK